MFDDTTHAAWVRRARTGDRRAFDLLMQALGRKILLFCLSITRGDEHRAQDLAQESWLKAWRGIRSYRYPEASFGTWVMAIARNQGIQDLRRRAVERAAPERPPLAPRGPSEEAEMRDLFAFALRRVLELPLDKRRALGVYLETGSPEEVAELLGIEPGHARVTIYRIMCDLRAFLGLED